MSDLQPGVVVTLPEIYKLAQATDKKVDELTNAVGEMVAVNKRLDSHHAKLAKHDDRLDELEKHKAVLDSRQRAPWWVVLGAGVGVVTGIGALLGLLSVLGQISEALAS